VAKIERVTWPKDDDLRHYALTFYPLMGGAGRGVVIRIDDITQRLSLEEMMVQSEKMLSVGGLAAGMAHEINNPLGAILHNVQNIRRRLSPELPKNQEQASELGIDLPRSTATWTAAKCRNCSTASSRPAPGRRRSSPTCSASAAAATASWRPATCRR
jgi:signal transduction histidine kinase